MTVESGDDDGGLVPVLTLRMGDYEKLRQPAECEEEGFGDVEPSTPRRGGLIWFWVKVALTCVVLGVLAGVFLKWVGPFFMDKVNCFGKFTFFIDKLMIFIQVDGLLFFNSIYGRVEV